MPYMLLPNNSAINPAGLIDIVWRFSLNLAMLMILVRWLYYSATRRKDYLFTYFLISILVFFLCYLLENVTLQVGFALGLFAIFGIIRYRTNAISIKEMTYLFLIIGVSVINSLADTKTNILELIFSNTAIILAAIGLEKVWLLHHEAEKTIVYDRIDLLGSEKYSELLKDVQARTGINTINKIAVGKIDLVKSECNLKIYYEVPASETRLSDPVSENNNGGDD